MRNPAVFVRALALAVFLLSVRDAFGGAAEEVRAAETAFAKAFADRDTAKFSTFIAEDAVFLSEKSTLTGRKQILDAWSGYLSSPKPAFSWKPERVVAGRAGDLALSTGPVVDPDGHQIGVFSTIWRRQRGGGWKVVFDGPGAPVCPPEPKPPATP